MGATSLAKLESGNGYYCSLFILRRKLQDINLVVALQLFGVCVAICYKKPRIAMIIVEMRGATYVKREKRY